MAIKTNITNLKKSATLAINEQVKQLKRKGIDVISFGLGQSPFPVPQSVVKSLKRHAHQKDYLEIQGLSELRHAIVNFHKRTDQLHFNADNIIVGPGSKELMFILQLCFKGTVIIPIPYWVSYYPQSKICENEVVFIKTSLSHNWELQAEDLKRACDKVSNTDQKLLILNSPNNPCGTSYKSFNKLAQVARDNNIIILSDEIYGPLNYAGSHISIAQLYPEGTIVSGGLSKWCGAGGWRIGSFAFPNELKSLLSAMTSTASESFTSVSAPIQYASVTAFNGNKEIDHYLEKSKAILAALARLIYTKLSSCGVMLIEPQSAFYLLPAFERYRRPLQKIGIETDVQLCKYLLEELQIAALPGSAFGLDQGALFIRMSFVDFDGSQALKALENNPKIDNHFLETNCPRIIHGIKQLVSWLNGLKVNSY